MKSDEKYQTLYESSVDGIISTDMKGQILDANQAYLDMLGYSKDELRRLTHQQLTPLKWHESEADIVKNQILARGYSDEYEKEYIRKDGTAFPISIRVWLMNNEQGQPVEMWGIVRDITEHKRAEEELRKSEERYRAFIVATAQVVWITNAGGEVVVDLPAWRELTGQSEEAIKGWGWIEAIHPDDRERAAQAWIKAVEAKSPYENEFRVRKYDGSYRLFFARGIPVLEADGSIREWVGTCTDITERKRGEAELKKHREHLEELVEERTAKLKRANEALEAEITERKQAAAALREWEAKYHALFQASADGILVADVETRMFRYANPAVCRLLGYSEAELTTMGLADILPKDDVPWVVAEFQAQVRGDKTLSAGVPFLRKDRAIVYADVSAVGMSVDGRVCIAGFFRDITERKRAEEVLRENEERFRQIAETIAEVFWTADPQVSRMLYISPGYERVWGRSCASLYENPRSFLESIHIQDRERVLADLDVQKTGQPFDHEYRIIRPDGTLRWIWDQGFPVRDETGQVTCYVGVAQDITERKSAEAKLRLQSAALEAAAFGIVITNPEGTILWVNPGFTALTGYTAEEALGQNPRVLKSGKHDQPFYRNLWNTIIAGKVWHGELTNRRKDGTTYVEEMTITPVLDEGGTIRNFIAMKQDVSERKQAAAALRESEAKYHALFQACADGILIADRETRIFSYANPAACRLLGYSEAELTTIGVADIHPKDDLPWVVAEFEAQVRGDKTLAAGIPCLRKDGAIVYADVNGVGMSVDGRVCNVGFFRDVTERKRAEAEMAERHRLATLVAEVGVALTGAESLRQGLQQCAEILVRDINAALARIWTVNEADKVLELEASAGMYTHLDGGHARVPMGQFKIGRIAENGEPHLTNTVQQDSWVEDPEWARREGMVAFAGYPLRVGEHVLGVVAAFARKPLTPATFQAFASVAHNLAQFIKRKRAEETLRESEEKYRALIETTGTGYVIVDMQGRVIDANPEYVRLTGHRALQEILGRGVTEWTVQHDLARTAEAVRRCAELGFTRNLEIEHVNGDGKCTPIEVNATVVPGAGGGRIVGLCRDITERKRAEQALREAEEQFRSLFAATPLPTFLWDLETLQYLEVNDAAVSHSGYSRDELLRMRVTDLLPPEAAPGILSQMQVIRTQSRDRGQGRHRLKDGRVVEVEADANALHFRGRRAVLAVIQDITERKRTQQALQESEERYRDLAENAAELIQSVSPQGQFLYVNRAWRQTLGYSEGEIARLSITDIISPQHLTRYQQVLATVMAGETVNDFETVFVAKNGTQIIVEGSVNCRLVDGKAAATSGIFRNVTARREIEKMKNEFVSTVSHELRTPLTSIRGSLGLLAGGLLTADPGKARRMVDIAVANTDRLVRLINDILDIERIESGRVKMEKRACEAASLMLQAVNSVRELADKAGVKLEVLPGPGRILADPDRVIQTLTNLLGNAIKFSPQGSTISLNLRRQNGDMLFEVKDRGRGIPADKLTVIFERFQQVDASDRREKGGTGLGLAICRSIVEQHGGRIWVESVLGQGSSFCFTLPAMEEQVVPVIPAEAPGARTILVCDDDASILAVVQELLEQRGYRVVAVGSGGEAVKQAVAQVPDAILLDLLMPEMNGWETMTALREHPETCEIPIIILSVLPPHNLRKTDLEVAGWIQKPVDETLLFQTLSIAITRPGKSARVLVVEDDMDLARVIREVFERHGHEVYHAQTGREAVQLAEHVLPNLVVLDLMLPEGDGFEVVNALRQNKVLRRVPLVVHTAKDLDDAERARLRLGKTVFLTKGRISHEEFEKQVLGLLKGIMPATVERESP